MNRVWILLIVVGALLVAIALGFVIWAWTAPLAPGPVVTVPTVEVSP